MELTLQWHGPFSVVDGTGVPLLFSPELVVANEPGVYFWTIPCNAEHLVYYVGKTDRRLRRRLKEEFDRAYKGLDWIFDPDDLSRGIKTCLYRPKTTKQPNWEVWLEHKARLIESFERFRRLVRVFIAPMPVDQATVRFAEAALMWAVWDSEESNAHFISNDPPWPKRPPGPFTIRMSSGERFRGLGDMIKSV